AFSFSASKNLGIGEGGMLVTDDSDLAGRISRQVWHGLGSQAWTRHHQASPQYQLGMLGFNYRFDDPRSALLLSCLKRLEEDNMRRATIDRRYRAALSELDVIEPTAPPALEDSASYCLFTAVLDRSLDRDEFRRSLADRGVQTSVHYPLLHKSGFYTDPKVRLPNSEDYASRCVTLPLFPQMEGWQQELVTDAVRESLTRPTRAATAA
ncbi:MAG TPA: DegT/DnrJ/EryC1/StrS family aminotransferase, partial [Solirubrobacterales bacterium]|nr:DegT/DnrJ/EryC1/StrS family aminotransferase [Solirubrobacterales bacterium]